MLLLLTLTLTVPPRLHSPLACSEMPGELQKVLEWFRDYKMPDGKVRGAAVRVLGTRMVGAPCPALMQRPVDAAPTLMRHLWVVGAVHLTSCPI